MKNILTIIKEEITKLNLEGVADSYGEKFGLSNPAKEMDAIAKSGIKQEESPMGKLVGEINGYGGMANIYMNPRSLNEFDENVRAITENSTGNLFIIQINNGQYHRDITDAINKAGIYDIVDAYDTNYNLTWHRINETNDFGVSISCRDFVENENNKDKVEKYLNLLKQKHPNFNFKPIYWSYLITI